MFESMEGPGNVERGDEELEDWGIVSMHTLIS